MSSIRLLLSRSVDDQRTIGCPLTNCIRCTGLFGVIAIELSDLVAAITTSARKSHCVCQCCYTQCFIKQKSTLNLFILLRQPRNEITRKLHKPREVCWLISSALPVLLIHKVSTMFHKQANATGVGPISIKIALNL